MRCHTLSVRDSAKLSVAAASLLISPEHREQVILPGWNTCSHAMPSIGLTVQWLTWTTPVIISTCLSAMPTYLEGVSTNCYSPKLAVCVTKLRYCRAPNMIESLPSRNASYCHVESFTLGCTANFYLDLISEIYRRSSKVYIQQFSCSWSL